MNWKSNLRESMMSFVTVLMEQMNHRRMLVPMEFFTVNIRKDTLLDEGETYRYLVVVLMIKSVIAVTDQMNGLVKI